MKRERNYIVDILKMIGTAGVILAHINPPDWLFNIRVFDVCMLVFASGLTLKSHGNTLKEYIKYLCKRFQRLIIPSWIFLILFFVFSFLMSHYNGNWEYSMGYYLKSFAFMGGVDLLWIIRVQFVLAIVSPMIIYFSNMKIFNRYPVFLLALLICVNEVFSILSDYIPIEIFQNIFKGIIVYTLGYAIVELIAIVAKNGGLKKMLIFSIVSFGFIWILSGFSSPQLVKYPPQALFILYGSMISLLVFAVLKSIPNLNKNRKFIIWISDNSLWIFLWHIFPISFIDRFDLNINFLLEYIVVVVFSVIMTLTQNKFKLLLYSKIKMF